MRRILTATLVGLLLTPTAIFAADDDAATALAPAAAIAAASTIAQRADLLPPPTWTRARSQRRNGRADSRRSTPARRSFRPTTRTRR